MTKWGAWQGTDVSQAQAHYDKKGLTFNAVRHNPDDNVATELIAIPDPMVPQGHLFLDNVKEE